MLASNCRYRHACVFLIAVFGAVDVETQGACRTVSNEMGVCVPALSCSTIKRILETVGQPLPPSVIEIMRNSHCGFFNEIHHVCCSPNRVISSNAGSTTSTTTSGPKTADGISLQPVLQIRSSAVSSDTDLQTGMTILEATECGESDSNKVGNGQNAELSQYPWMTLLVYSDSGLNCGGSLITDQYVLTAAHCIRTGSDKKLVSVRLGEYDIRDSVDCEGRGRRRKCAPPVQEIDVEEAIYHKGYARSEMLNDIGLLRLARRAVFNTSVQPICLPITMLSKSSDMKEMIIAGWGRMENGLKASILQKAIVPVKTNDYCQKIHQLITLTGDHLCAGAENDIDTCKGDSGGPIFYNSRYRIGVRWVQYGVISAGSYICGSEFPGVYMRLTSYVPWIASNIKT